MTTAYQTLENRFRDYGTLGDISAMMYWDRATMMPDGAAPGRNDQAALITRLRRQILLSSETADLLDQAETETDGLTAFQLANLRQMRREYLNESILPDELVEKSERDASVSELAWRDNRASNDFAAQQPHLETVLDNVRQVASIRAEAFGTSPYDALIDLYEPSLTQAEIDPVFDRLAGELPDLASRIIDAQAMAGHPDDIPGPFSVKAQKRIGEEFMSALGFSFDRGRLDESVHPFTGGIPDDVRLTTRYTDGRFDEAMMGILHETGHALYEQNLPAEWRGQPVGQSGGMALHESQSLLVEMQLCRGRAFVEWSGPKLQAALGGDVGDPLWSVDAQHRRLLKVSRGLIRVDADEVTYPLHVILRYRLEKALVSGDLAVGELPGAWNDGMAELVGVRPESDADGCLQDIHWMAGAIGYFPTYSLGALAAAQFYQAALSQLPGLDDQVREGEFQPLQTWLAENIHSRGRSESTQQILARVTGATLGADAFMAHLKQRYLNDAN